MFFRSSLLSPAPPTIGGMAKKQRHEMMEKIEKEQTKEGRANRAFQSGKL